MIFTKKLFLHLNFNFGWTVLHSTSLLWELFYGHSQAMLIRTQPNHSNSTLSQQTNLLKAFWAPVTKQQAFLVKHAPPILLVEHWLLRCLHGCLWSCHRLLPFWYGRSLDLFWAFLWFMVCTQRLNISLIFENGGFQKRRWWFICVTVLKLLLLLLELILELRFAACFTLMSDGDFRLAPGWGRDNRRLCYCGLIKFS